MLHIRRIGLFCMVVVMGLVLLPPLDASAIFDLTVTEKSGFDKMTGAANKETAALLKTQYTNMMALQRQEVDWDGKISALHYRNEQALIETKKRMQQMDDVLIARLDADVKRAKESSAPLIKLHDTLNKQLSAAKLLKSKEVTTLLAPQVEAAKIVAQTAKQDIRKKEDALKAAKAGKTVKTKQVRAMLADIDKEKSRINAVKADHRNTKKLFTAETKVLKQSVKKGSATATSTSYTRLIDHLAQMQAQKARIFATEQLISAMITKTQAQIRALSG